MQYFTTSVDHILAELQRFDMLVRAQVWRARQLEKDDQDRLAPFYISEEEIETLLDKVVGSPVWAGVSLPPEVQKNLQTALDAKAAETGERVAESKRQGVDLRLLTLADAFALSPFDLDVILICLAPELDRGYERLYAYLQDDITRKHPTVDLALKLLCPELETRITLRERLAPAAPLRRHDLLHVFEDPNQRQPSLLGKYLQLDSRVAAYLLGGDEIHERLLPYATPVDPKAKLADLVLTGDFKTRLSNLAGPESGADSVYYFQGRYGAGKQTTAEALCTQLKIGLLSIDGRRLASVGVEDFESLARLASREALLQGAALYWDGFDALLADDQETRLNILRQTIDAHAGLIFLAGDTAWEPSDLRATKRFLRLEFPQPRYKQRLQLWTDALDERADSLDLTVIAGKFRLSGGRIQDAAATAHGLARWRNPKKQQITDADLHAACRLQSNPRLAKLAQKITPHFSWDDIVLPPEHMEQLRAMCDHVKYRALVYESWGFDEKLALGKGVSTLFAGPPGTGKTMAADIMAKALGLDLYKIDLSTIVSKYIGETEKNLSRIFTEAAASNSILLFDEADALFGKRTEVRDSHDRYANIEVSYLLQKMEEYDGVVILATNLRQNMDEAFVRRLHFIVEFPFPEAEDRRRIWQGVWPQAAPQGPDVDLDFLAHSIEVAGGNIRNIAVASAFMAAADGGAIIMKHLVQATQREYRKMGKVLTVDEFQEHTG
ncbi:MAG: ATP-binding protein [Gammaproteobacteria bacterium]